MPVVKITGEYQYGLAVPAETDICIKCPPDLTISYEIKGAEGRGVTGMILSGERIVKQTEFQHIRQPHFFARRSSGQAASVLDIIFL